MAWLAGSALGSAAESGAISNALGGGALGSVAQGALGDTVIGSVMNAPEGLTGISALGWGLRDQARKGKMKAPELDAQLMQEGSGAAQPQSGSYNAIMDSPEWQQLISPQN